jgi:hypothetical protein
MSNKEILQKTKELVELLEKQDVRCFACRHYRLR